MRNCRLPISDFRLNGGESEMSTLDSSVHQSAIGNRQLAISSRSAFTMIELLITIGIIVLLLALSVPAFTWLTGSSSVAGAENTVSAMIGRARGDALGLQRDTGVLFFIDPASQHVTLAEVTAIPGTDPAIEARLELVADRDFLYLPSGVLSQVVDNNDGMPVTTATSDSI